MVTELIYFNNDNPEISMFPAQIQYTMFQMQKAAPENNRTVFMFHSSYVFFSREGSFHLSWCDSV